MKGQGEYRDLFLSVLTQVDFNLASRGLFHKKTQQTDVHLPLPHPQLLFSLMV